MESFWIQTGLAIIIGLVGYLFRQKNEEQDRSIKLLFSKHDHDVEKLQELEVHVAHLYYPKPELDVKFQKLEASLTHGLDQLGEKFDRLSTILLTHLEKGK